MKNIQPPRTLADCQFTVGHMEAEPRNEKLLRRSGAAADFVVLMIAAFVAGAAVAVWVLA